MKLPAHRQFSRRSIALTSTLILGVFFICLIAAQPTKAPQKQEPIATERAAQKVETNVATNQAAATAQTPEPACPGNTASHFYDTFYRPCIQA